jgi:hypothetical protein
MVKKILVIALNITLVACTHSTTPLRSKPKPIPEFETSREYSLNKKQILQRLDKGLPELMTSITTESNRFNLKAIKSRYDTSIQVTDIELKDDPKLTVCSTGFRGRHPALDKGAINIIIKITNRLTTRVRVETVFNYYKGYEGEVITARGTYGGVCAGSYCGGSYVETEKVYGMHSYPCLSLGYIEEEILDLIQPKLVINSIDDLTLIPVGTYFHPLDEKEFYIMKQEHALKNKRNTTINQVKDYLAQQRKGDLGYISLGFSSKYTNLGVLYARGDSFPKDLKTAFSMFELAANYYDHDKDMGRLSAQYNLGVMYAKGLGVAKNKAKAIEWFSTAAPRFPKAKFVLSLLNFKKQTKASSNKQAANTASIQTDMTQFNANINAVKDTKVIETDVIQYKNTALEYSEIQSTSDFKSFLQSNAELLANPEIKAQITELANLWQANGVSSQATGDLKDRMDATAQKIANAEFTLIDHEKSERFANALDEANTTQSLNLLAKNEPLLEGAVTLKKMQLATAALAEANPEIAEQLKNSAMMSLDGSKIIKDTGILPQNSPDMTKQYQEINNLLQTSPPEKLAPVDDYTEISP